MKSTGSFSREFAEYVPATKKLTPLLGAGEKTEYDAAYAAQPGELLVQDEQVRRLPAPLPLEDRRRRDREELPSRFSRPRGWTSTGFRIDHARRHVYASLNDGGYSRLRVLDAKTFAPVELPLPKDAEQVYAGSATRDGRFVTIGVETAQAPHDELRVGLGEEALDAVGPAVGAGGGPLDASSPRSS